MGKGSTTRTQFMPNDRLDTSEADCVDQSFDRFLRKLNKALDGTLDLPVLQKQVRRQLRIRKEVSPEN